MFPFVTLNNKQNIPLLGLGTWLSTNTTGTRAVETAIDVGYRLIDTASAYVNETEIGIAIANKINEGVVSRDDLFVTTKLWITYHTAADVPFGMKQSLDKLGLDYVDLYLMHYPMSFVRTTDIPEIEAPDDEHDDTPFTETWKYMERLVDEGYTKSIGISNFNSQQIDELLDVADIKPVLNQVECHPYLTQEKLQPFCENRGILVEGYSPLGSPGRPWAKPNEPVLMEDPLLEKLANKYDKTVAQMLIKWQVQRGIICIPKSVTPSRIMENADIFDFMIDTHDMNKIFLLDRNFRYCLEERFKSHKYYPFHIEY
ncbi:hypothetical protein PGB90_006978 [Kerria lacca]